MKFIVGNVTRFFRGSPDRSIREGTAALVRARNQGSPLPTTPSQNPVEASIVRALRVRLTQLVQAVTSDVQMWARQIELVRIDPNDIDVMREEFIVDLDVSLAKLKQRLDATWELVVNKSQEIEAFKAGYGVWREAIHGATTPVVQTSVFYGSLEITLNAGLLVSNGYAGGLLAGASISAFVAAVNVLSGYLLAVHLRPEIDPQNRYNSFRRWAGFFAITLVVAIVVVVNISFAAMRLPDSSTVSFGLVLSNPGTSGITLLGLGVAFWIFRKWAAISEPIREYRRLASEKAYLDAKFVDLWDASAAECVSITHNARMRAQELLHAEGYDVAQATDALVRSLAIVSDYDHLAGLIVEPHAGRIELHRSLVRNAVPKYPEYFDRPAEVEDYIDALNIDTEMLASRVAKLNESFDDFEKNTKELMVYFSQRLGKKLSELNCRYRLADGHDDECGDYKFELHPNESLQPG